MRRRRKLMSKDYWSRKKRRTLASRLCSWQQLLAIDWCMASGLVGEA